MRTITVHQEAAAALAPLAFGEFTVKVWEDGGYLAGWQRTVPGCACLVIVWPENMFNEPDAPAEFTPVGPWSYSGVFDVATAEGAVTPATGPTPPTGTATAPRITLCPRAWTSTGRCAPSSARPSPAA